MPDCNFRLNTLFYNITLSRNFIGKSRWKRLIVEKQLGEFCCAIPVTFLFLLKWKIYFRFFTSKVRGRRIGCCKKLDKFSFGEFMHGNKKIHLSLWEWGFVAFVEMHQKETSYCADNFHLLKVMELSQCKWQNGGWLFTSLNVKTLSRFAKIFNAKTLTQSSLLYFLSKWRSLTNRSMMAKTWK